MKRLVTALRHLFRIRPGLAVMLVVLALAAKLAIPAGYMPVSHSTGFSISLCSGEGPAKLSIPLGDPAKDGDAGDDAKHVCPYSALAFDVLAAATPPALPVIVFAPPAIVAGTLPRAALPRSERLRPPLRAPPFAEF